MLSIVAAASSKCLKIIATPAAEKQDLIALHRGETLPVSLHMKSRSSRRPRINNKRNNREQGQEETNSSLVSPVRESLNVLEQTRPLSLDVHLHSKLVAQLLLLRIATVTTSTAAPTAAPTAAAAAVATSTYSRPRTID